MNDKLHLATVKLPSIVDSVELYCSKTHMARKDEIEKIVLQPGQHMQGILNCAFERLKDMANARIFDNMKTDESAWITEARKLCRGWAIQYDVKDFFDILKRHGSKKKGRKYKHDINWDGELTALNREPMEDYFRNLQDAVHPIFLDIEKAFTRVMDQMRKEIRGSVLLCCCSERC